MTWNAGCLVRSRFWSEFVNQIARFDADSLGDPQKRMEADPLLATFNFANINWMKVGFFGQLFLAQARLYAVLANGIAENFKLLRLARHIFYVTRTAKI